MVSRPLEQLQAVKRELADVGARLEAQAAEGRQLRRRLAALGLVVAGGCLAPLTLCRAPSRPQSSPAACACPPQPCEGEALSDLQEAGRPVPWGRKVPERPEDWQKKPPCDGTLGEAEVRGACYVKTAKTPPCERLLEHDGGCYRSIAAAKPVPVSVEPGK